MSKQVTFKEFCKHYELKEDEAAQREYEKYCESLSVFNFAIAEDVTKEAIKGMKQ